MSPILSNIYLDKLDKFVEQNLLPAYNGKQSRQDNKRYNTLSSLASYYRKRGQHDKAEELVKQARQLPSGDPHDPEFRRLVHNQATFLGITR
jgi:hypothetical protein